MRCWPRRWPPGCAARGWPSTWPWTAPRPWNARRSAAAAIGWLIAGRVLRPLSTITAAARRISASSLNERLALQGPGDELKELADTLDSLFARLGASFDAQRRFDEVRHDRSARRIEVQERTCPPYTGRTMTVNAAALHLGGGD
jgi:HAMP domain-containing protein